MLSTQCLNIAVWEHCCLFWALGLKVGYFEFGVLPVSGSWLLAIWLMRSTKKLHDSHILGLHGSYYEPLRLASDLPTPGRCYCDNAVKDRHADRNDMVVKPTTAVAISTAMTLITTTMSTISPPPSLRNHRRCRLHHNGRLYTTAPPPPPCPATATNT